MDELIRLIKKHEGCHKRLPDGRLTTYLCPAGIVTIGWGSIGIPPGTIWTQQQADDDMLRKCNEVMLQSLKLSPILGQYPIKHQAIADFLYNLGSGRYKASTLRKRINEKQWDLAVIEIEKWVFGGGKKLPGLIKRRQDEAALLL